MTEDQIKQMLLRYGPNPKPSPELRARITQACEGDITRQMLVKHLPAPKPSPALRMQIMEACEALARQQREKRMKKSKWDWDHVFAYLQGILRPSPALWATAGVIWLLFLVCHIHLAQSSSYSHSVRLEPRQTMSTLCSYQIQLDQWGSECR